MNEVRQQVSEGIRKDLSTYRTGQLVKHLLKRHAVALSMTVNVILIIILTLALWYRW